jgi:SagB-type dehydrogenase family enzyme
MTGVAGLRTVPSAGELYPLECYLVVGQVDGLAAGVYRYVPQSHCLQPLADGDVRLELSQAALEQEWVREGAALLVLTAEFERTRTVYGERGTRCLDSGARRCRTRSCRRLRGPGQCGGRAPTMQP